MKFDIIEVTDEYFANLTNMQRQLLRSAQKKKDELTGKAKKEIALYKKFLYTNGVEHSSLLEQKTKEIQDELTYEVEVIREQLLYSLELNEPFPDGTEDESVGYLVDYSLTYTDRYIIVRDYYLSIQDPAQRMSLYSADDVARRYLDKYYSSLYNVLYTYSQ